MEEDRSMEIFFFYKHVNLNTLEQPEGHKSRVPPKVQNRSYVTSNAKCVHHCGIVGSAPA